MSGPCIPLEELARVMALPEGDPARRHLDRCTRCRSLADLLRGFESPGARPPEAGFEAADPRLRATIAELTGIPDASAAPAAPRAAVPARAPRRAPWWSLPSLRLAGAAAALLVVSAAGVALWQSRGAAPRMRAAPAPDAVPFVSEPAREVGRGLELSWLPVAGADAYRVVFFDDALREVARVGPLAVTTLRLDATALPPGLTPGATVGWQVEALSRDGDRVRVTPTRALRVP